MRSFIMWQAEAETIIWFLPASHLLASERSWWKLTFAWALDQCRIPFCIFECNVYFISERKTNHASEEVFTILMKNRLKVIRSVSNESDILQMSKLSFSGLFKCRQQSVLLIIKSQNAADFFPRIHSHLKTTAIELNLPAEFMHREFSHSGERAHEQWALMKKTERKWLAPRAPRKKLISETNVPKKESRAVWIG